MMSMNAGYRTNLLPLIEKWKESKARVAIFGIGTHTEVLFETVPELADVNIVGFLDSNPDVDGMKFKNITIHRPEWAQQHADVVLCSSFLNELQQAFLMNSWNTKTVISHFPLSSVAQPVEAGRAGAGGNAGIFVPLDGAYVLTPPADDREPFSAIAQLMDGQHDEMRTFIRPLLEHYRDLAGVPEEQTDDTTPYWNNGFFSGDDARMAYSMVKEYKPRRIVEIGSGNSTKFFRRAITDSGAATELISIDPQPRSAIDKLCDRRVRSSLQNMPLSFFEILEAQDFLFFDGSHVVFQGSDCPYFYLRLLPLIRAGVYVHIHDIALPYAYPPEFDSRYYNEQHILAALLLGNNDWRVRIPVNYLFARGDLRYGGVSFWMERV